MKKKNQQPRDRILAIKVTIEEKRKITNFATEQCVNVSALVRKLLLDLIREDAR